MSLVQCVLLDSSRMPSAAQWSRAIVELGFTTIELDPHFRVKRDGGHRPCLYKGRKTGFEYAWELIEDAELDDDVRDEVLEHAGERDAMVSLVTRDSEDAYFAALVAAAVLAKLTDGVYWHAESNDFFTSEETLKLARESEPKDPAPDAEVQAAVVLANRLLACHPFAVPILQSSDEDPDTEERGDLYFEVQHNDWLHLVPRFGSLRFLAPVFIPDSLGAEPWERVTISAVRLPCPDLPELDRYARECDVPLFAFKVSFPVCEYTGASPLVPVATSAPVFVLARGLEVEIDG